MPMAGKLGRFWKIMMKRRATPPSAKSGYIVLYADENGHYCKVTSSERRLIESSPPTFSDSMELTGRTGTFDAFGTMETHSSGLTANYSTPIRMGNNHSFLKINSITAGGDIIFTGTSLSEISAVPIVGDTETLTIDETTNQYYQTTKKFQKLDSIDISGVNGINYDFGYVGYLDALNTDFRVLGYRVEMNSSGPNPNAGIIITKIQDDGEGKMSLVTLENIGIKTVGTDEIIDYLRTGDADRSDAPGVTIWPSGKMQVFKNTDFDDFFTSGENEVRGSTSNSGLWMQVGGCPPGGSISGVARVKTILFYDHF